MLYFLKIWYIELITLLACYSERKFCSGSKLKEMTGSGIFAENSENDDSEASNPANKTSVRMYQVFLLSCSETCQSSSLLLRNMCFSCSCCCGVVISRIPYNVCYGQSNKQRHFILQLRFKKKTTTLPCMKLDKKKDTSGEISYFVLVYVILFLGAINVPRYIFLLG